MGGTFDPPHIGHLIMAASVKRQLGLNRVVFMPAAVSPFKTGQIHTAAEMRMAMTRLAIQDESGFSSSDYEILQGGTSYTADTVRWITTDSPYKTDRPFLLVGADSLVDFYSWHEPQWILDHIQIVAVHRPGYAMHQIDDRLLKQVQWVQAPLIEISSTMIRELRRQGHPIRFYVPESVYQFIEEKELYLP